MTWNSRERPPAPEAEALPLGSQGHDIAGGPDWKRLQVWWCVQGPMSYTLCLSGTHGEGEQVSMFCLVSEQKENV